MKQVFIIISLILVFIISISAQNKIHKDSQSVFFKELISNKGVFINNLIKKSATKEIDGIFGSINNQQTQIKGCFVNHYSEDLEIGEIDYSDGTDLIPKFAKNLQEVFKNLKIQTKQKSVWREYLNLSYKSSNFRGFVTVRGTFKNGSSNNPIFVLYLTVNETLCN